MLWLDGEEFAGKCIEYSGIVVAILPTMNIINLPW